MATLVPNSPCLPPSPNPRVSVGVFSMSVSLSAVYIRLSSDSTFMSYCAVSVFLFLTHFTLYDSLWVHLHLDK